MDDATQKLVDEARHTQGYSEGDLRSLVRSLAAALEAAQRPPVDTRMLRDVWGALGCAWNPDDFKPNVRATMWGQALDMIRESVAQDSRVYRENQQLEAEVLRLRAQRPTVSPEVREELAEVLMSIYDHGTQPNALREADAILARFSVPPQPVYDEEGVAEVIARALTGFDLHMQAGVPSHTYVGRYEAVQLSREAAAALVAALRGGELTREETNE